MRIAIALLAGVLASVPYHIDFTRIFPSPEAEKAARGEITKQLAELQAMRGNIASSGQNLLHALRLNDTVQMTVARHAIYLYLRYAVDTRDEKSREERTALYSEVDAKTAFVQDEILHVSDEQLAALMKSEPQLATYRYAIDSIRRWGPHTLTESEEKVLAKTAPLANEWQFDLYERLIAHVPAMAYTNPDPAVREQAFQKRWEALVSQRDLIAFALLRLASSRNAIARERHFDDGVESSYFGRELTRPEVRNLLERVAAGADVYKRYQQLRAANVWDLYASRSGFPPPQFTIDQARQLILEATAPLGEDYGRELRALLDPANGRIDVIPGPHRKGGGFSQGAIGTDSVFFSGGFTGTYDNVRNLMHESTHAVQRQLMSANHVPMVYADGPHYLAESLAIFNELVLADFMAEHAKTPAERAYYLEQFLDGKGMIAIAVAPEAELEEAVYDGVKAGTIHGAVDLDALTKQVYSKYSIWPSKNQWMVVELMYEDPFYDLNYVYGGILGLRMFSMYKHDPAAFARNYVAMMRNGYSAPANDLLHRYLGIDLGDPNLLTDMNKLLDERVEGLRATYH